MVTLDNSPAFPWSQLGFEALLWQGESFQVVPERFGESTVSPWISVRLLWYHNLSFSKRASHLDTASILLWKHCMKRGFKVQPKACVQPCHVEMAVLSRAFLFILSHVNCLFEWLSEHQEWINKQTKHGIAKEQSDYEVYAVFLLHSLEPESPTKPSYNFLTHKPTFFFALSKAWHRSCSHTLMEDRLSNVPSALVRNWQLLVTDTWDLEQC